MAQKKLSVEKGLSVLHDIPEDISKHGNEEPLDIESDNDEFILVTSSKSEDDNKQESTWNEEPFDIESDNDEFILVTSSKSEDDNIQEPPGKFL